MLLYLTYNMNYFTVLSIDTAILHTIICVHIEARKNTSLF